jgi:MOSC domain-containing protein YiiM
VESITLVAGKGIAGDKSFGRSKTRQVNIVSTGFYPWYEERFGRTLPPGGVGENVIISPGLPFVDGIDPDDRPDKVWVRLGTAVLLYRVRRLPCQTLANTLSPEDPRPPIFGGRIGALFSVESDGEARLGDKVEILSLTS